MPTTQAALGEVMIRAETDRSSKTMLKDAVRALSLANLLALKIWWRILTPRFAYLSQGSPRFLLLATCINVFLVAALIFVLFRFARSLTGRSQSAVLTLGIIATACLVASEGFYSIYPRIVGTPGPIVTRWFLYFLIVLFTSALLRWQRPLRKFLSTILLVLSPFSLVTFGRALTYARDIYQQPFPHYETHASFPSSVRGQQRIVWILFDELDQHLAFTSRPGSVSLPNFDALAAQSFFAHNAFPPAGQTLLSLPSLTTGSVISGATPGGPSDLELKTGNSRSKWSAMDNVFRDAQALSRKTALAGWFHPYCRIFSHELDACFWVPGIDPNVNVASFHTGLADTMWAEFERNARKFHTDFRFFLNLPVRDPDPDLVQQVENYRQLVVRAQAYSANPDYGLVFLHLNIPHPYGIYDVATHRLSAKPGSTYLDNLQLADLALGDIRRSMEAAGVWSSTTVMVSSDHWWRTEAWSRDPHWTSAENAVAPTVPDHRVPFMVKLAGQEQGASYDSAFNTVVTRALVKAIFNGSIQTTSDLTAWMDRNRTFGELPTYQTGW
jgi:hypothetical protein